MEELDEIEKYGKEAGNAMESRDSGSVVKGRILEAVGRVPLGLTIEQIADFCGSHRQTVAKYALVLEAEGLLKRRRVGVAMLHYPNTGTV